jgi:predicted transcriptional regulator
MTKEKNNIFIPDFMIILQLLKYKERTPTEINLITRITHSHVYGIKNDFLKQDWISIRQEGRNKYMCLTEKGKLVSEKLNDFIVSIGIKNEELLLFRRQNNNQNIMLNVFDDNDKLEKEKLEEYKNMLMKKNGGLNKNDVDFIYGNSD